VGITEKKKEPSLFLSREGGGHGRDGIEPVHRFSGKGGRGSVCSVPSLLAATGEEERGKGKKTVRLDLVLPIRRRGRNKLCIGRLASISLR